MDKRKTPRKINNRLRIVTTLSQFGIDSSMLVEDNDILEKITTPSGEVLVRDDQGIFSVGESYIDNGLARPARVDAQHRAKWDEICEHQGIILTE